MAHFEQELKDYIHYYNHKNVSGTNLKDQMQFFYWCSPEPTCAIFEDTMNCSGSCIFRRGYRQHFGNFIG